MFDINSQIATLKQNGEQVAGLYDIELRVVLQYTTKDGMKDYKPVKRISSMSYWLIKPVTSNEFEAEFYQVVNNDLILMDSGKVIIDFPDKRTLDRRLYAPINVVWVSDFEH
jgi:hypothetical protein